MPTAARTNAVRGNAIRPAQDEWGMFDPEQAGIPATLRVLTDSPEPLPATPAAHAAEVVAAAPIDAQSPESGTTLYTVESPLRCPQCQSAIRTFRALRVSRTQVPFISTLPRKGYVLVCPECAGLLSAELSGLL